jgi:competence protein ComEC
MVRDNRPPRQPLFWAAVVFSLGLWMGERAWRPPSWWVIAIVAFIFASSFFLPTREWLAKTLSLGAWFLLGALLIQVRDQRLGELQSTKPQIAAFADGSSVLLTGHIIREGYAQDAYPGAIRESVDVETEEISGGGETSAVRTGVRLTIREHLNSQAVEQPGSSHGLEVADGPHRTGESPVPTLSSRALIYGSRLRIRAKLHPARNYRNPGAFDYEGYLRDNGISLLDSADAKDIESLPGFSGSRVELWRTRVHASIVTKIHQLWPSSQASLMDAMVLGEESFLRNATRTEYQRSGTYHVLVVSGMNLSILAFAFSGRCVSFAWIPRSRRLQRSWSRSLTRSSLESGHRYGARR